MMTPSIIALAVSCAVFEIKRLKTPIYFSYHCPLNLHDHLKPLRLFFFQNSDTKCQSSWALGFKNIAEMLNSLSRVQQRHRRTTAHAIRRT